MGIKLIKAKFAGKCNRCSEKIMPGDVVFWSSDSKAIWHEGCDGKPPYFPIEEEKPTVSVGEFKGVYELFEKASLKLKYPRIRMFLPEPGITVDLMKAGPMSKMAGMIKVIKKMTVGNFYFGHVTPEGHFYPSFEAKPYMDVLTELLGSLAEEPALVAAYYGKLTGRCIFCDSELTDPRSTEMGYGPVCAQNWGLPWGEKNDHTIVG